MMSFCWLVVGIVFIMAPEFSYQISSNVTVRRASNRMCERAWTKILVTNVHGAVTFGSKSDLIDAVLRGARVRFFVSNWGQGGYAAEFDNLSIKGTNVCGQALMHVSRRNWDEFQNNAYWWFVMLCTTGKVYMTRYNIGSHTHRGTSTSSVNIIWFVQELGSANAVYSHSGSGNKIKGSIDELIRSVQSAYDLRVVTRDGKYSTPLDNVDFSGQTVSGQSIWHVSQRDAGNHSEFQSNAYWWFTILSSNGLRDMSRWSLGLHQSRGHTNDRVSLNWFTDSNWRHVFTNDENGETLNGCLDDLIRAVENGHRVKVVMGSYSTRADNVRTKNGQVSAQLLNHISKSSKQKFQDNAYWYWQMVHTTGTVRTRRYNVGDGTNRGDSVEKKTISWFVDTRRWRKVLSSNKLAYVILGSKVTLRNAIKHGASVRVGLQFDSTTGYYVTEADNVEFGPRNEVSAQAVKSISLQAVGPTEFEIQNNPYWWFIIVNTQSVMEMSRWRVGEHISAGHNSQNVSVDWYVSY